MRVFILHIGLFALLPAFLDCNPKEGRPHLHFIHTCISSLNTALGTAQALLNISPLGELMSDFTTYLVCLQLNHELSEERDYGLLRSECQA